MTPEIKCYYKDDQIHAEVTLPDANEYTQYAFYLYLGKDKEPICKTTYTASCSCCFDVQKKTRTPYYVTVFIMAKQSSDDEYEKSRIKAGPIIAQDAEAILKIDNADEYIKENSYETIASNADAVASLLAENYTKEYLHGKEEPIEDLTELADEEFCRKYKSDELDALFGIANCYYIPEADFLSDFISGTVNGIDVSITTDWAFDGNVKRALQYRMCSFNMISSYLVQYLRTSKNDYRDKFLAYIFNWILYHQEINYSDSFAWHDDATARRTFYFSCALVLFKKILTEKQYNLIFEYNKVQTDLLCRDYFYKYHHNHGMYQDRAVAMFGLIRNDNNLLSVAKNRVRDYFDFSFSNDGVHKEHSPSYHCDIMASICWFKYAFKYNDEEAYDYFAKLLDKSIEYTYWITMPNTKMARFGDSPEKKYFRYQNSVKPAVEYLLTNGKSGEHPVETAKAFFGGGYGIIRDGWSLNSKGTWMVLSAATHSEAHKHNDDLNFLLYHNGPIITEAGKRNYEYTEPMTEFAYSSYAHNVLFVDDKGWLQKETTHLPILEKSAYDTMITDAVTEGNMQSITAKQTRFEGVSQVRTLRYRKLSSTVDVTDEITISDDKLLTLIYHIAENITVTAENKGYSLFSDGKQCAEIIIDSDKDANISLITGNQTYKNYKTWLFNGSNDPIYGSLIIVEIAGKKGLNTVNAEFRLM